MKYASLLLLVAPLLAQEAAPTPPTPAAVAVTATPAPGAKCVIVIDPKVRGSDYIQAFDYLRRDKPTMKIVIRTTGGTQFYNVTDLSATTGGTLLLVKYLSNQGNKTQIVPVEDIVEIAYSAT